MATVIVLFVWEKLVLLLNQADLFRPLLLNLIILMSDSWDKSQNIGVN